MVVRNEGRTSARACVSQMTFQPLKGARVTGVGLLTQESLDRGGSAGLAGVPTAWVRGDRPVEITIHPHQQQRFEVCRLRRSVASIDDADITIPTEEGYGAPRLVFAGRGFEFAIQVGSDNAEPVARFGRAEWRPARRLVH
jgi:hypothetical protein